MGVHAFQTKSIDFLFSRQMTLRFFPSFRFLPLLRARKDARSFCYFSTNRTQRSICVYTVLICRDENGKIKTNCRRRTAAAIHLCIGTQWEIMRIIKNTLCSAAQLEVMWRVRPVNKKKEKRCNLRCVDAAIVFCPPRPSKPISVPFKYASWN